MKPNVVSFKTKLGVTAVILLCEAIVVAGCWAVAAFSTSDRSGPSLPPLTSLTETRGMVVGFSTSQERTRSYHAPVVEFLANNEPQQIGTRSAYNWEAMPFRQGDSVLILYDRTNPEVAWLKWEYERYAQDATTLRFGDIAGTIFMSVTFGIVGLTIVALLIYMIKPITAD